MAMQTLLKRKGGDDDWWIALCNINLFNMYTRIHIAASYYVQTDSSLLDVHSHTSIICSPLVSATDTVITYCESTLNFTIEIPISNGDNTEKTGVLKKKK